MGFLIVRIKHILDHKIIALMIVAVLLMSTVFFAYACNNRGSNPSSTDVTNDPDATGSLTTPTMVMTTEPETTTTTETTVSETTTTTVTTQPEIKHHFSHLIVFLDIQQAVFFHTNEAGEAIAEISLPVATGREKGSTPITSPDKPFIMPGFTARLMLFTKSRPIVWVRYATHVAGDIYFHSQPYDHFIDPDGQDVPLDKSLFNLAGYRSLGRNTISHGCIRLCMRDSIFLANTVYRGMPLYIFQSSKGYDLPKAEELPPVSLNTRWDPTDMDPANPYRQQEQNNMAWKYRPIGQQTTVLMESKPIAADSIKNANGLPAGTTFRFLYTPGVSEPVLRTAFIVVTYPDGSYEEVRVKLDVVDPAQTTPTTEPTETTPVETTPVETTPAVTTTTVSSTPAVTTTTVSSTPAVTTTTVSTPPATTTPDP